MSKKKSSAYQVGLLRDLYDQEEREDDDIFTLTTKAAELAKRIKASFDPLEKTSSYNLSYSIEESSSSISSAIALKKAVAELLKEEQEEKEKKS